MDRSVGDTGAAAAAVLAPGKRVVEIGGAPVVWTGLAEATDFFSTFSVKSVGEPDGGLNPLTPFTYPRLARALASPDLGLVVVHVNRTAAWSPRSWVRSVFNRRRVLARDFPVFAQFGPHLVGRPAAPLAVVDHDDVPVIMAHNFRLLDKADVYFKRELPIDRWQAFLATGHRDLPSPRFRGQPKWRRRIAKLEPIALGLPLGTDPEAAPRDAEKISDVFFAGLVERNSSLRERGIAELDSLAAEGIRVDRAEGRVRREEFYRRLAGAWLAWSPGGLGHDCFRHYEAAMCGTVPIISRQPIERDRPFIEGEHAFYYDVEPGGLARTLRMALADRDRLAAMGERARDHVLAHHTPRATARHIVSQTLSAAARNQTSTVASWRGV